MATIHREGNLGLLDGKVAVIGYGSQGHAHALNLHDSGVDVQVGLREGSGSWQAAEEAGLSVATVGDAVQGAQIVSLLLPDQVQPDVYDAGVAPNLADGAAAPLRARVQRPLRPHRPARRPRRDHGRAQGAGPHRPPPLHRGVRDAGAGRGRAGRERARLRPRARVRGRHRRDAGGRDRDDLHRGDGERPVRRAGRPLRRRHRADPARLRDAGRGGLPAGDRVLRVPPRAEADRRPDLRGWLLRDALLRLRHRRVRRPLARASRHRRPRPRQHARSSSRTSARARSPRTGSSR